MSSVPSRKSSTSRATATVAASASRAATTGMTAPAEMQQPHQQFSPATGSADEQPPSASTATPGDLQQQQQQSSGKLLIGQVRKNGLERPFARDQVISWMGHSLSAACFYVAAISILLEGKSAGSSGIIDLTQVAVAIHALNFLLLFVSWVSCERIDPSKGVAETLPNGWFGIKLSGPRWEKARYCALCRKTVPGLDHHCTWLQTCVGKSNYAQFFTIACTGAIQFLLQVLYASFCLVWLDLPFEHASSASLVTQGFLIACLLISVPCTMMYFILLGFHVWLSWLGYGTYEWMLRRRKQKSAAQKAREAMKKKMASASEDSFPATSGDAGGERGSDGNRTNSTSSSNAPARPASDSVVSTDSRHLSSIGSDNNFMSANGGRHGSRTKSGELTAL